MVVSLRCCCLGANSGTKATMLIRPPSSSQPLTSLASTSTGRGVRETMFVECVTLERQCRSISTFSGFQGCTTAMQLSRGNEISFKTLF